MNSTNLEVHIEELVLHGLSPDDRFRISEAVQHELTRLFTDKGTPLLGKRHEVARLDGGAFEVKRGSTAEAIGVQVAQAVHGGLSI